MDAFPVLLIALVIWIALAVYLFSVDRKVSALEKQVDERDYI